MRSALRGESLAVKEASTETSAVLVKLEQLEVGGPASPPQQTDRCNQAKRPARSSRKE